MSEQTYLEDRCKKCFKLMRSCAGKYSPSGTPESAHCHKGFIPRTGGDPMHRVLQQVKEMDNE
jgi:hypothetical protein